MKKDIKQFIVNIDDLESKKKAEKEKARLENKGYKFDFTQRQGLNDYLFSYSK